MTTSPTNEGQPSDDLDRLLRDYYRAKMPRSFPSPLDGAASLAAPVRQPSSLSRGRVILAACVVAVVLGFGYLLRTQSAGSGFRPVGLGGTDTGSNVSPHGKAK